MDQKIILGPFEVYAVLGHGPNPLSQVLRVGIKVNKGSGEILGVIVDVDDYGRVMRTQDANEYVASLDPLRTCANKGGF